MADRNVLSIAFDDSTSTNYETQSLFVQKIAPRNVNLSATGVLSGDVIWEINTPKDTFLDLSKTYMSAEFEMDEKQNDTIYTHKKLLLPCMFQRGTVYLNGVRITSSNNYTQDGFLSRRLAFGESYNKSVNSMYDMPDIAKAFVIPADLAAAANKWIAKDTLDSFWIRQSEGLIVPPNSNIRIELTADSKFWEKNYMTGDAVTKVGTTAPKVKTLSMHPCFYVNPSEVKSNYRLRFISINSYMSQLAAAANKQTIQYTISPTITKVCYTMQRDIYQDAAAVNKRTTAFMFDNTAGIQTLQFKHGNVVFPQTVYSFSYGLDQAYEDYINHSQQIAKDSGKEVYDMYSNKYADPAVYTNPNNWGPIFVAPLVKDRTDPTNTIELNATFTATAATTYTILSSLEEQAIDISMDGMEIKTTPTI